MGGVRSGKEGKTDGEKTHASEREGLSPDGVLVTVVSGRSKGAIARVPAEEGLVVKIGKARDNDLVLPDDTVSRHHLTIARARDGLLVRDLASTNGVRVGGARVTEALVEPGAVILAGDVELIVGVETQGVEIPPSDGDRFGDALGKSLAMRRIFGLLERTAPTRATVLLMGETGTGKDVLAHGIHEASPRAAAPFEVVDCGAVTGSLIESDLFGHEKGAFTGAIGARAGAFERANGGTLFLDEIGELPLELQPKLLRVLEAREVRRVGGSKTIPIDVRVVAATTRDLLKEVRRGNFREDLYFRLAVVPVNVPPLRKRDGDVPLLAQKILDATRVAGDGRALHLSKDTLHALRAYEWPGNVRELRNVLERAAFLTHESGANQRGAVEVQLVDFPPTAGSDHDPFQFDEAMSYRQARARVEAAFERRYVRWLLARHGGNISAAARVAQMDRKYLGDLAKKHGIGGGEDA
ncbi:MAG: sigma 54-interacting transcriptional regulator [Polyangiales bacterium]